MAVIAIVLTMSVTVAPRDRSLTGLFRPCSTGPTATALYGLVGVVAGVQVGEHEDRGGTGDGAAGQFAAGDVEVDGGVVLDRPLHLQVGTQLADQFGRGAHLVDVGARPRCAGRVAQHGDPGLDAEHHRGVGGRGRDVGELFGVRVGVDGTVAVDQHPVGQQHQEHARHDGCAGLGLDELEGGADRVGGRVHSARDHGVDEAFVHHHRAEVADVGHDVAGAVQRDPLVPAQLEVPLAESVEQLAVERVDHGHVVEDEAEFGGPLANGVGVAEQGQVAHLAASDAGGGAQDPVVGALGQDDVGTGGTGAFDQLVLEHDGSHHVGAPDLDAVFERVQVDVRLEVTEGEVDLALVARGDRSLHGVGGDRGVVGIGVDGEQRDRRAAR